MFVVHSVKTTTVVRKRTEQQECLWRRDLRRLHRLTAEDGLREVDRGALIPAVPPQLHQQQPLPADGRRARGLLDTTTTTTDTNRAAQLRLTVTQETFTPAFHSKTLSNNKVGPSVTFCGGFRHTSDSAPALFRTKHLHHFLTRIRPFQDKSCKQGPLRIHSLIRNMN